MRIKLVLLFTIIGIAITFAFQNPAIAVIDGPCVNCHTMHNSQDGTSMNFDKSPTPNEALLRADCFGCHARGLATHIDPSNGAPQVSHTGGTDLAGGNFAYVAGNNDSKVHNVIELGNNDDILTKPPGQQHADLVTNEELTCAGTNGCHGKRFFDDTPTGLSAINGAHHNNTEGKIDSSLTDYNIGHHYRFLMGIKGLEDSDWQASVSANDHNEYFGATTPMDFDGLGGCAECHEGGGGQVRAASQTISGLCATCHGNFHALRNSWLPDPGIGGNTSSPFVRHPTDVVLPASGEYASAFGANGGPGTYDPQVPVARATVPDAPSATVTPGTTDVVMCLSCHAAHGTDYPDILRWDYTTMIAGGSGSGGCFTCHTQKN